MRLNIAICDDEKAIREYVFKAFDVAAFHYLLKPIEEDKFHEVFQWAKRKLEKRKNSGAKLYS